MPYIPHTEADVQAMLASMGLADVERLFEEIPENLRSCLNASVIPKGINEAQLLRLFAERARDVLPALSFLGAGAYEHHIPALVWDIVQRGEVLTAYTPYQAEASQGALQGLFEYQSMMARLLNMEVVNASLYEGASSLAEAVLMSIRLQPKKAAKILMPVSVHPHYRQTVHTIVNQQEIECISLPYDKSTGQINLSTLNDHSDCAALVIAQPNFFGAIEDVDQLVNAAHAAGLLVIACVNPIAMALLKEPGSWGDTGADIVCGEGQPLGVPLASGGPYFGFFATRKAFVRQMPGRLVGKTCDAHGKPGYTLTLQAREQHIRRSRATSNICTNQGLLVSAATYYLAVMGEIGLTRVAKQCHHMMVYCQQQLSQISGIAIRFNNPYFHEVVLQLPKASSVVLSELAKRGIYGGFNLSPYYPELDNCILVCVTETKTKEDIDLFRQVMQEVLA